MTQSYRALCADHYVNQKLAVKLDLPRNRETVLDLFERVRRSFPGMQQFRRYKEELALESVANALPNRWMAVRAHSIRSGVVNPDSREEASSLHRNILEVAPYFLSISPLDIDFLELLYGFDLQTSHHHDQIVFNALIAGTPLAEVMDGMAAPIDCQPLLGFNIGKDLEAHFEVKTRAGRDQEPANEPISIYLTLRKYGPVGDIGELVQEFDRLADRAYALIDERLIPRLLNPIRTAIGG